MLIQVNYYLLNHWRKKIQSVFLSKHSIYRNIISEAKTNVIQSQYWYSLSGSKTNSKLSSQKGFNLHLPVNVKMSWGMCHFIETQYAVRGEKRHRTSHDFCMHWVLCHPSNYCDGYLPSSLFISPKHNDFETFMSNIGECKQKIWK